jgi:hypothetical protein
MYVRVYIKQDNILELYIMSNTAKLQAVQTGTRDAQAPDQLYAHFVDADGNLWGVFQVETRTFSTGSVGYYANGKLKNPLNQDAKYQVGITATLCGSKPQ